MEKVFTLCLLLLVYELSGQNFQRTYKSGNEDPDLVNMVLLQSGNLIAAGTYASQELQPVWMGISTEGALLWQRGMNASLQQGNGFSPFKMLALPNGNALVLFVNLNTVVLFPAFVKAKVLIAEVSATDGSFVWRRYLGDEDLPVVYNDAALLPDGILLTGYVSKQFSLAKISYQGDLIWQKNYSGPDPSEAYQLDGLVTNAQGEIYAVGAEYNRNAFSLHKFDNAGNSIWSKRYDLAASDTTLTVQYKALQIPNAFTPDGDQVNDRFKPIIRCPAVTYRLRIFNRWGQLLFETADTAAGWDGVLGGEAQPSDVYLWTVEISDLREEGVVVETLRGNVTLLR